MKVKVDKEKCIGCGACAGIVPSVFDMDDDGLAKVNSEDVSSLEEDVRDAAGSCPTDAIEITKD